MIAAVCWAGKICRYSGWGWGCGDEEGPGPTGGLNSSFSLIIRNIFQLCIASIHARIFDSIRKDSAVQQDGKSPLRNAG